VVKELGKFVLLLTRGDDVIGEKVLSLKLSTSYSGNGSGGRRMQLVTGHSLRTLIAFLRSQPDVPLKGVWANRAYFSDSLQGPGPQTG